MSTVQDVAEMDSQAVCRVLKPLFDLGDFREINGPTGSRLAQLIAPRDAADLTVREVLALLAQIDSEWRSLGWKGDAP